ncbi:helix-turn-helix transcriptional regulator [Pseudoduganella sp. RAF53_2]|jgi:AraC family transcriptional regulator|uniref:helix-turn-helix transcriptional regulator n=1 Tax=unclassified Pseudoduganella TaxID=2637179 RepID=UPI003F96A540
MAYAHPHRLAPRALLRIKEFIDAHLHEEIDLSTLAGLANVSRFHFARLFRATVGVSAMTYVEQCRMERAQALILAGELQLAQVASLVGYDDPSYFTRRFRHRCGQTPSAWARAH